MDDLTNIIQGLLKNLKPHIIKNLNKEIFNYDDWVIFDVTLKYSDDFQKTENRVISKLIKTCYPNIFFYVYHSDFDIQINYHISLCVKIVVDFFNNYSLKTEIILKGSDEWHQESETLVTGSWNSIISFIKSADFEVKSSKASSECLNELISKIEQV